MFGALRLPDDHATSAQPAVIDRLRQVSAQLPTLDVFDLVEGEALLQPSLEVRLERFALQLYRTLLQFALHVGHFGLRLGGRIFQPLPFERILFPLEGEFLKRFFFHLLADERFLLRPLRLLLLHLLAQFLFTLLKRRQLFLSGRFGIGTDRRLALCLFCLLGLQLLGQGRQLLRLLGLLCLMVLAEFRAERRLTLLHHFRKLRFAIL